MRHLCIVLVALFSFACSETPTAPESISEGTFGASSALKWEVRAQNCSATSLPSPIPTTTPTNMLKESNGSMTATWAYSKDGRPVILYANFVSVNGEWTVCSWDTADV